MKKEPILYGVVGLLLGISITWLVSVYAVNNDHASMMKGMGTHSTSDSSSSHDHDTPKCNNLQCSENE